MTDFEVIQHLNTVIDANKHKAQNLIVNGKEVKFVTITILAKLCKRATPTLKKYEERGILPPANYRTASVRDDVAGNPVPGNRIYSVALAETLAKIFLQEIQPRTKITAKTLSKIRKAFADEKINLS